MTYSEEQNEMFQLIRRQLHFLHDSAVTAPRKAIVQGKAGGRKSTAEKNTITIPSESLVPNSYVVLALTGDVASNIHASAQTIRSALRTHRKFTCMRDFQGKAERKLQLEMETLKFIFIDEYFMIGWRMSAASQMKF